MRPVILKSVGTRRPGSPANPSAAPARSLLSDSLAWCDRGRLAGATDSRGARAHATVALEMRGIEEHSGDIPVLNLLSHRQEGLLNVCGVLGRRLEEGDVQLIGEFLHNAKQVVPMK